jgi:peptidoglycan/xylan/chitin deacetylase (PgdA/CDA1 family)
MADGARLAVSVLVNYEEGSERSHAMRDADQESMTKFGGYAFPANVRNLAMESMYEYGSRVGVWRILESLRDAGVPATFFWKVNGRISMLGAYMAHQKSPSACACPNGRG